MDAHPPTGCKRPGGKRPWDDGFGEQVGPERIIAGSFDGLPLVRYYAEARAAEGFALERGEPLPPAIEAGRADVILLEVEDCSAGSLAAVEERIVSQLGYRPLPSGQLPPDCASLQVFLRR